MVTSQYVAWNGEKSQNHSQLPSLSSRMDTDGLSTARREQQSRRLGSLDTGSELGSSLGRQTCGGEDGGTGRRGSLIHNTATVESSAGPMRARRSPSRWFQIEMRGLDFCISLSSHHWPQATSWEGGTPLRNSASYCSLGQFPITCVATNIPAAGAQPPWP